MTNTNEEVSFEQLYNSAVECLRQHDISGAVEQLVSARSLEGDIVGVDNLLASSYMVLGEYMQAVACWQEMLKFDPGNKSAHKSLELFNRPSNLFWIKRYNQAVKEVEKKNYSIARDLFYGLLAEQDGHVKLYQLLGLCCLACEERQQAIAMWQKGLELDKYNRLLHDYIDSIPVSSQIEQLPTTPAKKDKMKLPQRTKLIWAVSGMLFLCISVFAVFIINRSSHSYINKDNNSATISNGKSVPVAMVEKKAATADKMVSRESITDLAPAGSDYDIETEEAYYLAGLRAYLDWQWQNAVDNFSVVVGMASGDYLNREALYYLARTNYLKGNLEQAEQGYVKYLKDFPGTAYCDDSLFYLGCVYSRQNRIDQAVAVFQQLKNIAPDSGYLSSSVYTRIMN